MKKRVRKKSADDDPVCICGYPRIGLPAIGSPCPECGSTKLAVYLGSYSYYGWNVALLGAGISFAHSLFVIVCAGIDFEPPEVLFFVPWVYVCVPLGGLSLLYTVISVVKREPKRKSVRNIGMAMISGLGYPIALSIAILIFLYANGSELRDLFM